MLSRIHKIVTIFDDMDGVRAIQREYKTVSEGGVVRDIEIEAAERQELYAVAHQVSSAILADARHAEAESLAARDDAQAKAAKLQAALDEALARIAELDEAAQ